MPGRRQPNEQVPLTARGDPIPLPILGGSFRRIFFYSRAVESARLNARTQ